MFPGRLEKLEKLLVEGRIVCLGRIGRDPLAKIRVSRQAVGNHVRCSARIAAVEDAQAFGIRKAVEAAKQHQIFGGQTGGEKVNLHGPRSGDFACVIGLDSTVATKLQQLESIQAQVPYMMAGMCRSIKILRRPAQPATKDEISAAALQFVRKVSGYNKPSRANQEAFDAAIVEIAGSVERLLGRVGALGASVEIMAANERK
jgi:hypothetical protein